MSPLAHLVALPIRAYRLFLSPWLGRSCRFLPTCSEYALDALAEHGALRGSWLASRRILRCRPGGGHGFDPVPGRDRCSPDARCHLSDPASGKAE